MRPEELFISYLSGNTPDTTPISDKRITSPASEQKKPDATGSPDRTWRDTLNLAFNGAVAFATVVGVIFLVLQWRQTDDALKEARESNRLAGLEREDAVADGIEQRLRFEEQISISQQSVNAAIEGSANTLSQMRTQSASMKTSAEVAQIANRPYVVVDKYE